jgi:hypothetical protein
MIVQPILRFHDSKTYFTYQKKKKPILSFRDYKFMNCCKDNVVVSYFKSHPNKGISCFVLSFFSCSTFCILLGLTKWYVLWHVIKMRGISIALEIPLPPFLFLIQCI